MIQHSKEFKAIDQRFQSATAAHDYVLIPLAEWELLKAKMTSPTDPPNLPILERGAYKEFRDLWCHGKRYQGMRFGTAFCAHFTPSHGVSWLVMNLPMTEAMALINDLYVLE